MDKMKWQSGYSEFYVRIWAGLTLKKTLNGGLNLGLSKFFLLPNCLDARYKNGENYSKIIIFIY
jgi:hypothetical protein